MGNKPAKNNQFGQPNQGNKAAKNNQSGQPNQYKEHERHHEENENKSIRTRGAETCTIT